MTNSILKPFKIHSSYNDFFTKEIISELNDILKIIEQESFTPQFENIFRALQTDLKNNKVVLLGMDPYPQEGVATGLAFQVNISNWDDKRINTSMKNILKLLYKTYFGSVESIDFIRNEIKNRTFDLLPPNELFFKWQDEGVLLLNSALTTKTGIPGAHIKYWKKFIIKLIKYIDDNNHNLTWLLWGGKAQFFEKYISKGSIIKHNHPAICGKMDNPKDFLNGNSFSDTMDKINWV